MGVRFLRTVPKTLLGDIVWPSLRWLLEAGSVRIWKCSIVFR